MTIDLDATKEELERLLVIVNKRIQGTNNISVWSDLSPNERATVDTLTSDYNAARMLLNQWLDAVTKFIDLDVSTKLTELGANLPTIEVPASMIAVLNREFEEAEEARGLFIAEPPPATHMQTEFTVSDQ